MIPVRVTVSSSAGVIIHERIVDHDDADHRAWMGKTAFWAVRHGHSMTTAPAPGEDRPRWIHRQVSVASAA